MRERNKLQRTSWNGPGSSKWPGVYTSCAIANACREVSRQWPLFLWSAKTRRPRPVTEPYTLQSRRKKNRTGSLSVRGTRMTSYFKARINRLAYHATEDGIEESFGAKPSRSSEYVEKTWCVLRACLDGSWTLAGGFHFYSFLAAQRCRFRNISEPNSRPEEMPLNARLPSFSMREGAEDAKRKEKKKNLKKQGGTILSRLPSVQTSPREWRTSWNEIEVSERSVPPPLPLSFGALSWRPCRFTERNRGHPYGEDGVREASESLEKPLTA